MDAFLRTWSVNQHDRCPNPPSSMAGEAGAVPDGCLLILTLTLLSCHG